MRNETQTTEDGKMKCELRNYKPAHSLSEETLAFTASLWIDDKKAADVSNRGHGDPIFFHFLNPVIEKIFYLYCKSLPPLPPGPEKWMTELPMDADLFVEQLCEQTEHKTWIKRQTRGKILFRLIGDQEGSYRTVSVGSPKQSNNRKKVVVHIRTKYGDKIEEFLGV